METCPLGDRGRMRPRFCAPADLGALAAMADVHSACPGPFGHVRVNIGLAVAGDVRQYPLSGVRVLDVSVVWAREDARPPDAAPPTQRLSTDDRPERDCASGRLPLQRVFAR